MVDFDINQWMAVDERIPWRKWDDFRESYYRDRNLNPTDWKEQPQHRVFAGQLSWLHLLPHDTITRIRSNSDLSAVLPDILRETIQNIQRSEIDSELSFSHRRDEDLSDLPETERRKRIEAALCGHLVGTLKGDVDFEKLQSDNSDYDSNDLECPEGNISVPIKIVNSNNFADYAIYSFTDTMEVFGQSYGSSTWMFKQIIEQDVEPDTVIRNVAFFDRPNIVWGNSSPPEFPISFAEENGSNMKFWKVQNPKGTYRDSWGDVSQMDTVDQPDHIYTADSTFWTISLGMIYK